MRNISSVLLLLALSLQAAFANEGFRSSENQWNQQRAQTFNAYKNIESISHRERIAILQEAEACIQAASNRDQYRACEDREKQARQQSNEKAKASHQALRAKLEQLR